MDDPVILQKVARHSPEVLGGYAFPRLKVDTREGFGTTITITGGVYNNRLYERTLPAEASEQELEAEGHAARQHLVRSVLQDLGFHEAWEVGTRRRHRLHRDWAVLCAAVHNGKTMEAQLQHLRAAADNAGPHATGMAALASSSAAAASAPVVPVRTPPAAEEPSPRAALGADGGAWPAGRVGPPLRSSNISSSSSSPGPKAVYAVSDAGMAGSAALYATPPQHPACTAGSLPAAGSTPSRPNLPPSQLPPRQPPGALSQSLPGRLGQLVPGGLPGPPAGLVTTTSPGVRPGVGPIPLPGVPGQVSSSRPWSPVLPPPGLLPHLQGSAAAASGQGVHAAGPPALGWPPPGIGQGVAPRFSSLPGTGPGPRSALEDRGMGPDVRRDVLQGAGQGMRPPGAEGPLPALGPSLGPGSHGSALPGLGPPGSSALQAPNLLPRAARSQPLRANLFPGAAAAGVQEQGAPGTRQAAGRSSSSSSERGKYQGMPPLPCSTVPGLQQQDAGASSGKGVLDMLQQQRLHRMEGAPSVSTGLQVPLTQQHGVQEAAASGASAATDRPPKQQLPGARLQLQPGSVGAAVLADDGAEVVAPKGQPAAASQEAVLPDWAIPVMVAAPPDRQAGATPTAVAALAAPNHQVAASTAAEVPRAGAPGGQPALVAEVQAPDAALACSAAAQMVVVAAPDLQPAPAALAAGMVAAQAAAVAQMAAAAGAGAASRTPQRQDAAGDDAYGVVAAAEDEEEQEEEYLVAATDEEVQQEGLTPAAEEEEDDGRPAASDDLFDQSAEDASEFLAAAAAAGADDAGADDAAADDAGAAPLRRRQLLCSPDTALRDFSTKEDMQRLPGASTRGLFVHKAAPTVGQLQLQVEQLETAAQAAAAEAVAERARADAAAAEAADLRATLAALQQTNSGGAAAADAQGAAAGHAAGPGTHSMAAGASMGQGTGQQQGGMSPAVQLIAQLQALVQKQQDSAAAHHQPLSNLQVLEPGQQGIDAPGQAPGAMPAVLPINAASLQLQQRIDEYGQRLKQVSQELQAAGQLLHSYQRQLAGDQAACAAEAGAFTQQLQTAQQQLDAAQQQHADQQELVAGVLAEVSRMQTEQQQELALQLTASIMQTAALGLQQLGTVEETAAVIVQSLLTELGDSQLVLDSQRGLLRRLQQRYRQRQEDVLDLVLGAEAAAAEGAGQQAGAGAAGQAECSACGSQLEGSATYCSNGGLWCSNCSEEEEPPLGRISFLEHNRAALAQHLQQLQQAQVHGSEPTPAQLLQRWSADPEYQRLSQDVQHEVQANLEAEVTRLQPSLAGTARHIADNVRVLFVAGEMEEHIVERDLVYLGLARQVLGKAGEGVPVPLLSAALDHIRGCQALRQEVQKLSCFVFVEEGTQVLLTHALQLAVLRNADGSVGFGAHSGEVMYWAAAGEDPEDGDGLMIPGLIRSIIGDLTICSWALTVRLLTLSLYPAAPQGGELYLLRVFHPRSSWRDDVALNQRYHKYADLLNRLRQRRAGGAELAYHVLQPLHL